MEYMEYTKFMAAPLPSSLTHFETVYSPSYTVSIHELECDCKTQGPAIMSGLSCCPKLLRVSKMRGVVSSQATLSMFHIVRHSSSSYDRLITTLS
jgi:hypothetical protein